MLLEVMYLSRSVKYSSQCLLMTDCSLFERGNASFQFSDLFLCRHLAFPY